jgi:hypothetical protein
MCKIDFLRGKNDPLQVWHYPDAAEKTDDDQQTRDERRTDVRMSDAKVTAGGPTTAVPAAAPYIDIDIVGEEQRYPWVRMRGDATAQTTTSHENCPWNLALQTSDAIVLGDWYCNCGKWRRPTRAICQCGASEHLVVSFQMSHRQMTLGNF